MVRSGTGRPGRQMAVRIATALGSAAVVGASMGSEYDAPLSASDLLTEEPLTRAAPGEDAGRREHMVPGPRGRAY
jgi:hypothetical protein